MRENDYAAFITSFCRKEMTGSHSSESEPMMQRLYNRIWLLAAAALVFFALSYVAWGWVDVFSVPLG